MTDEIRFKGRVLKFGDCIKSVNGLWVVYDGCDVSENDTRACVLNFHRRYGSIKEYKTFDIDPTIDHDTLELYESWPVNNHTRATL